MDFTFSAEQELLRDGLSKFLSGRYDLETSRAAAKSGAGWQPDIWQSFAEELGRTKGVSEIPSAMRAFLWAIESGLSMRQRTGS